MRQRRKKDLPGSEATRKPKNVRSHAEPLGTSTELEPRVLGGRGCGGLCSPALFGNLETVFQLCAKQEAALSTTVLGRLKREIPRRLWGELYWALSFLSRGLQSAGLRLHCLHFPHDAFYKSAILSSCFYLKDFKDLLLKPGCGLELLE